NMGESSRLASEWARTPLEATLVPTKLVHSCGGSASADPGAILTPSAFRTPPLGRDTRAAPRKHNPPAIAKPHPAPPPDGLDALALAVARSPTAMVVSTLVGIAPKRIAITQASRPSNTRARSVEDFFAIVSSSTNGQVHRRGPSRAVMN